MTFSIIAHNPATGNLGIAVATKALAVGSIVPFARAGVGAIATQAAANVTYGPHGLDLLAQGRSPADVIATLTGADPTPLSVAFGDDQARQAQWAAFLQRTAPPNAPERFADVVGGLGGFLRPLIKARGPDDAHWLGAWRPGAGWSGLGPA